MSNEPQTSTSLDEKSHGDTSDHVSETMNEEATETVRETVNGDTSEAVNEAMNEDASQVSSSQHDSVDPLVLLAHQQVPEWWESSIGLSFIMKHRSFFVAVVMFCFSILLIGGLIISHIQALYGLMVFASDPQQWRAGHSVAVRLEARSLDYPANLYLSNAEARWIDGQGYVHHTQAITERVGPFLQANLQTPMRTGDWTLEFWAQGKKPKMEHRTRLGTNQAFEQVKKEGSAVELVARTHVKLLPTTQKSTWKWPGKAVTPSTAQARQGKGLISIFALHHQLSFELTSAMVLVAQNHDQTPWQGEIHMLLKEGKSAVKAPQMVTTNDLGVATWDIRAQSPLLNWKHQAMIQDSTTISYKKIWPQSHQASLHVAQQMIQAGQKLTLHIRTLNPAPMVYVDLWHQDRWIATHAVALQNNQASVAVSIPQIRLAYTMDEEPSLYWIQAYTMPYIPSTHKASRYLLSSSTPANHATQWLKTLLVQHKVEPEGYWNHLNDQAWMSPSTLSLALGRMQPADSAPKLIINSAISAQTTMQRIKKKYQSIFVWMMVVLCSLLCMVIIWMMWTHDKNFKANLTAQPLYLSANRSFWRWFVPIMSILILFFTGLVSLIFYMEW